MDPVPYQIKIVFHVFGGFMFLYTVGQAADAFLSESCVSNDMAVLSR